MSHLQRDHVTVLAERAMGIPGLQSNVQRVFDQDFFGVNESACSYRSVLISGAMRIQDDVARMVGWVAIVHERDLLRPGSDSFSMVLSRVYFRDRIGPFESQLSTVVPLPNITISQ
jgi:hypothetical protein